MGGDVRTTVGVPKLSAFANGSGTPIVIDTLTGQGYFTDKNLVVPLEPGGGAGIGPVLILNTLPDTAPPAGYVPAPLLWGATPLNPLGMYTPATGVITIKEAGLYAFRGMIRCNHPGGGGSKEGEVGVNLDVVSGTQVGLVEFRPLIVNWDVDEILFLPLSATFQCAVNDVFRFDAYSATGGIVSVGGGNAGNSQIMVTRIA